MKKSKYAKLMELSRMIHNIIIPPKRICFYVDVTGLKQEEARAYLARIREEYQSLYGAGDIFVPILGESRVSTLD